MPRHQMDAVRAAITNCRDTGLGKHGAFKNSDHGMSALHARWHLVQTAVLNNTQTDGNHDLTRRLLQMAGMITKFLEQYAVKPLPTVLEFNPKKPTPGMDPEPKGRLRT